MNGKENKPFNIPVCDVTANYCKIFENMGEGVSIFEIVPDENGKVIDLRVSYINPASILNKFKFRDEIIGRTITDLFPVDKVDLYLEMANEVLSTGKGTRYETYFAQINKYFLINTFSPHENICVTVDVDITREKDAEKNLLRNEKKFRTLFENNNDAIIILDYKTGKHIDANKKAEELTGYSKKELMLMNAPDLTPKDLKEGILEWLKESWEKNKRIESELLTKDLKRIPVEGIATVVEIDGLLYTQVLFRDIMERKRSENELKESEKRYRKLLENSFDAVVIHSRGKIISANSTAAELFGAKSPGELIDKPLLNFVHPNYRKVVEERVSEMLKGNRLVPPIEEKFLRIDGKSVDVEVLATGFNYKGKKAVQVVFRDISQRKNAQKKLREAHDTLELKVHERTRELEESNKQLKKEIIERKKAEEKISRLADIVEYSDDAIIGLALDGTITSWNKGAENVYGYSAEEMIGKTPYLTNNSRNEYVDKYIEMLKKGEKLARYESKRLRKDGKEIYASVKLSPIKNSEGKVTGVSVIVRDITHRKKAEEEIKRSNRILNGINQIFQEALTAENEEKLGKTCLTVCEKVTGSKFGFICEINDEGTLDATAISNPEWNECKMPQSNTAKFIRGMKIHGLHGGAIKLEKSVLTNDPASYPDSVGIPEGHSPIITYLGVPLKYGNETIGVIGLANKEKGYTLEDQESVEILSVAIAESLMSFRSRINVKNYRDQLEETVKELKRSNEELQQFAYITSHDLQEPLRTIASFTQLIERRYKGQLDRDADEYIEFIVDAAVRMKEMIQGLLKYSRIDAKKGVLRPIDIEEVIKTVLSNLHVTVEENNAEIFHNPLPTVIADENQLIQLFQNLIGNAIKFKKPEIPPKIHISCRKDSQKNEYVFSVSDNGIGMESQYKNKIFEVFKRLHTIDEYKGAGIGLAISKRIVERHGGHIWVESEQGLGSTFYFTIPIRGENNAFKNWDKLSDVG